MKPSSLARMFQHESASGVLLVIMAMLALILANSPLNHLYDDFLSVPLEIRAGSLEIAKPLLLWINDGLMAVFFFLVGLEIKREVFSGNLSRPSNLVLPGIAAIAGIAAPAVIYYVLNKEDPLALQGWAIPSATDIAFAVGIFSLFGARAPLSLKIFLLTVAIFDDLCAILIIAIFYSSELSITSLSIALVGLAALLVMNRMSVIREAAYLVVGLIVWVSVLKSGVHATLAGFAIAWFIPLKLKNEDGFPMLPHMEHALHPWVAFAILPLFAFANAGVSLNGISLEFMLNPIPLGIALGLFVGKQLGIFGVCFLTIKLRLAKLPENCTWLQFYAVTVLCGIGFTMSLFIGSLAFENVGLTYLTEVKLGVLVGSMLSAVTGSILLALSQPKKSADLETNKLRVEVG